MARKYLIDVEIFGSLLVEAANPQAAAARANSVLRAITAGFNDSAADDAEVRVGAPVDLERKMAVPN